MRRKLVYSILIALISSMLFVSCNSSDSGDSTDPTSGGDASAISANQVDYATKSVGSSVSAISEGVFEPLKVAEVLGGYGMPFPVSFPGGGLPENGVIYEGDGIAVSSEGYRTDPPGLLLGVALDEFVPVEGAGSSVSGDFTALVSLDKTDPLQPRVTMVLTSEDGSPLIVNGGEIEGTTLEFDELTLYYNLSPLVSQATGVEGTLLINGEPASPDMLAGMVPGLPELPELPDLSEIPGLTELPDLTELPGLPELPGIPGLPEFTEMPELPGLPDLSGDGVTSDTLKVFVELLRSSLSGEDVSALLKQTLLSEGVLESLKTQVVKSLGCDVLPFPVPEDLLDNPVIYEGDGIKITFVERSVEPAGLLLKYEFEEFVPMEGLDTSVTGNLLVLAGIDKSNMLDPGFMLVLNSEEGAPLTLNGGQVDGTTLEFDEFTLFYKLSPLASAPVETEGTVLINGKPVSKGMLQGLLPALPGLGSEGVSTEALEAALETLRSSFSAGDFKDLLKDTLLSGDIVGFLTKSKGPEGLPFALPTGLLQEKVIHEGDGITITYKEASMAPPGLLLEFALDDFVLPVDESVSVSGTFTLLASIDSSLLDPKLKMTLNTGDSPLVFSGGDLDGTTVEFDDFTIYYNLSPVASEPMGVDGMLLINGMPVALDRFASLLGGL